ncbi:helix-turn-helix domain-containing protein [Acinetobacter sp. 187]|uniref:AraC family transcriptional regulator n=1 Tax=Acinetobacter lanii TaxID=2715163 RepID=UPI00140A1DEF|nr:AraC family transcriptional regulator [Acinetobacter lanii]NHC03003.1 helix-turn-helix domain-containing protein [Acinetobacter lanii]
MTAPLKDYSGSVYGGLGQLLYHYCACKGLEIPATLANVQQAERFDFSLWREILNEIQQCGHSPALGLDIAGYVEPKHLGIIAYIALSCDTLAEALTRYQDLHRLIYDGSPLKIDLVGEHLAVRWDELPVHLTTQITDEIAIALLVQFLRLYLQVDQLVIHEVHFKYPAPKNVALYEGFFHCKVRFSQPTVQILFPLQFLQTTIKQADQTLQKLLLQQANALLDQLPNSTQLDERLQQSILLGLQKNRYQIDTIAAQLNLSVRQLQRHLKQQHTTYQQRVQAVRQLLAIQYLQDPYLSLQEIALLLSYSEQSAFQRAFKQWMGMTPQQWRTKHGHQAKDSSSPNEDKT